MHQLSTRNFVEIGSKGRNSQATDITSLLRYTATGEEWGRKSNTQDVERGNGNGVGFGGSTIRKSRRCKVGRQQLGCNAKGRRSALYWRHLENSLSGNNQSFGREAIRLAGLRPHHRTHCLNRRMVHCCVMVSHCRHGLRRLAAVALTFRSLVAYTHQCASPSGSCHPGQKDRQKHYRSCGS